MALQTKNSARNFFAMNLFAMENASENHGKARGKLYCAIASIVTEKNWTTKVSP